MKVKPEFDEEYQKQIEKRQTTRKRLIQLQNNERNAKYAMCQPETRKLIRARKRERVRTTKVRRNGERTSRIRI